MISYIFYERLPQRLSPFDLFHIAPADAHEMEEAANIEASRPNAGLLDVPCEILLEITSYFGNSDTEDGHAYLFPSTSIERQHDMRSLMRTCSALRSNLIPYYWRRLDACFDRWRYFRQERKTQESWEKSVLGHLKAVTSGDRNIAQYIRCVFRNQPFENERNSYSIYCREISISLYQTSLDAILEELIRCMQLCPNLDTTQIIADCVYTMKASEKIGIAFEGLAFPNIHTACLVHRSRHIIKALPNIRHFHWFEQGRSNILESFILRGLNLESFHGLSPAMIQSYRNTDGEKGASS